MSINSEKIKLLLWPDLWPDISDNTYMIETSIT